MITRSCHHPGRWDTSRNHWGSEENKMLWVITRLTKPENAADYKNRYSGCCHKADRQENRKYHVAEESCVKDRWGRVCMRTAGMIYETKPPCSWLNEHAIYWRNSKINIIESYRQVSSMTEVWENTCNYSKNNHFESYGKMNHMIVVLKNKSYSNGGHITAKRRSSSTVFIIR